MAQDSRKVQLTNQWRQASADRFAPNAWVFKVADESGMNSDSSRHAVRYGGR